ncbi:transmembrane protein 131 homolog, partial [Teleopsis dalmanni]|uniref:transmembrane protein 131 homolog n=1 Tax=Teleopsis dalmanni TaxID=139649 RepID=UPI0018CE2BB0
MMPFTMLLFCFCLASAVDQLLQPSEKINFNAQQTSSQVENIFPITSLKPNGDQILNIRFDPPHLDFGVISVGTAQSHTITVINQHNRSVYLGSVSGQISSFYSSFFETKIIPPQGNTTFNVVFLPRESGTLQSVLHVHSSFGLANFSVRGVGTECPYKLQPIVGVKAPLNATLTPEIHMFNPHKHTMQIIEVYSSGGQFQLELPSGGQEGPQALWEIPPYSTKPVIRIRFHGKNAGNHTAYIRIKVLEQPNDSVAPVENVFVIPVEFEIQQENGLYAENPVIDFGRIVTQDTTPTTVKLNLRNSDENSPYELVYHDLHNISGLSFNINDTSITLDPMLLDKSFNFKLALLRSALKRNVSHIQEFSVLIRADVFKGTLSFNRNTTIFITGDKDVYKERKLIVRNEFKTPLLVLKSSVESNITKIFNINQSHSKYDVVLKPGESLELMQLQTKNLSNNFRSMLNIYTNVTRFEVPLLICTGQLHVHTQISGRFMLKPEYNTDLNLGLVPLAEMSQPGYIVLQNKNPIPIKVTNWDFQTKRGIYFHTTFMGCAKITSLKNEQNIENVKYYFCSQLNENEVAVFELAIQSYITENKPLDATLQIWTPYENITATVRFKTMIGDLEVDQETVYFKNCFPGMLCSSDISIRSTFQYPIHITSVNFTDPSMHFEDFNPKVAVIDPGVSTKIGRLYFSPAEICKHMCYIPQDERTNSLDFLSTQPLTRELNNNPYFDEGELRRRTELYRQFKAILQSISFRVSTQEKRQFVLQLMIDIVWPKLVSGPQTLPSVEINKSRKTAIVINNPANKPILVDFFLSNPKFAKLTRSSLPLEVVVLPKNCHLTDQSVFSLSELSTKQPVLIPAYENITVTITFTATQTDLFCTLLHIRNNLTLYEGVWISAKGVQSQFRFGNRKPGSTTPLLFEVNEKHLSSCYQQMQPTTTTTEVSFPVNIKRTFTARNTGEIPIFVETFFVEGQQCIGYGFKIVDCTSFELAPNASKKIEILFSPDFTIARIAKLLVIKTNLSYNVNYTLLAQLPTDSLELCGKLIARPEWETQVRYAAIIVILSSLAMVVFAVHLDLYKIFKIQDAVAKSRDKGPVHPTFNLRNIGIKSLTPTDDSGLVVVT